MCMNIQAIVWKVICHEFIFRQDAEKKEFVANLQSKDFPQFEVIALRRPFARLQAMRETPSIHFKLISYHMYWFKRTFCVRTCTCMCVIGLSVYICRRCWKTTVAEKGTLLAKTYVNWNIQIVVALHDMHWSFAQYACFESGCSCTHTIKQQGPLACGGLTGCKRRSNP